MLKKSSAVIKSSLCVALTAAALVLFLQTESQGQWFPFNRSESLHQKCINLFESGNYPEARECIRRFLNDYPQSHWSESLYFLDAKLETNAPEAITKYRWFLHTYPYGPNSDEAAFLLGELYELAGDFANAQECYLNVYLLDGSSRFSDDAGLRAAKCLWLQQDIPSALKLLEEYLAGRREYPWSMRAGEMRADILYQSGEYAKAQEEYRQLISETPSSEAAVPRWYLQVARIYEINGDNEAALQCYRQFEKAFPDSAFSADARLRIIELARLLNVKVSEDEASYILQAGSFSAEPDAASLAQRLKALGYQANVVLEEGSSQSLYSVQLGPYKTKELAQAIAEKISKEAGVNAVVLSPDSSEGKLSGE